MQIFSHCFHVVRKWHCERLMMKLSKPDTKTHLRLGLATSSFWSPNLVRRFTTSSAQSSERPMHDLPPFLFAFMGIIGRSRTPLSVTWKRVEIRKIVKHYESTLAYSAPFENVSMETHRNEVCRVCSDMYMWWLQKKKTRESRLTGKKQHENCRNALTRHDYVSDPNMLIFSWSSYMAS